TPAQRFCTATYTLDPNMTISDATAANGTYGLPHDVSTWKMRYEVDGSDNPLVGGAVELLFMFIRNQFQTSASGVVVTTTVNHYAPRCNGELSPAEWNPPAATCADDNNLVPVATGTVGNGVVIWDQCDAADEFNS